MLRAKLTYPQLKEQVIKLSAKYRPKTILIEDKASGQQLIQDLKFEGLVHIAPIKPKFDKITHFASSSTLFQTAAYLPKQSAFNSILLNELLSFPYSKNDDIVDSISQFLNFMKEQSVKQVARIREF